MDTGAYYGVKKCAEAEYISALTKGKSLMINGEAMKSMDIKDVYKFLGFEEGNGVTEKMIKS